MTDDEKPSLLRRVAGSIVDFGKGVSEVSQNKQSNVNTPGRQMGRIAGKTGRALKNVATSMERDFTNMQRGGARIEAVPTSSEERRRRARKRQTQRGETHIHIHIDGDALNNLGSDTDEEDKKKDRRSWVDEQAKRVWE